MRILILPSWYPPDQGSFFRDQTIALQKNGAEVSVIYASLISFYKLIRNPFLLFRIGRIVSAVEDGFPVYRSYYLHLPNRLFERSNLKRIKGIYLKLFKAFLADNDKPDLIHVHSAVWGGYAALKLSISYSIPYVITEHRSKFAETRIRTAKGIKNWYADYLPEIYNNARGVILVGSILQPVLSGYFKSGLKYRVISNGVYTNYFHPADTPMDDEFRFCMVGGLIWRKGTDWLLRSFTQAKEILQEVDLKLMIVGDGSEKRKLKRLRRKLGLRENVGFLGELSNEGVRDVLQKSHAFVLPTRFDAQGVVYLEALSCALPIISTTGAPSEICPQFAGIRVPVDDIEEMTKAIVTTVRQYKKYDRQKIRQFAVREYDFNNVVKKIMSFYGEVLSTTACVDDKR